MAGPGLRPPPKPFSPPPSPKLVAAAEERPACSSLGGRMSPKAKNGDGVSFWGPFLTGNQPPLVAPGGRLHSEVGQGDGGGRRASRQPRLRLPPSISLPSPDGSLRQIGQGMASPPLSIPKSGSFEQSPCVVSERRRRFLLLPRLLHLCGCCCRKETGRAGLGSGAGAAPQ